MKNRCLLKLRENHGAVMLLVVIIMTILFSIGTIVLIYSIRQHRYDDAGRDQVQLDLQVDTALAETIVEICNRMDVMGTIGEFTLTRNSLSGVSGHRYEVMISEDDDEGSLLWEDDIGFKTHRINRSVSDPSLFVEIHLTDIQVRLEVTDGVRTIEKKYVVKMDSTTADYYQVGIQSMR